MKILKMICCMLFAAVSVWAAFGFVSFDWDVEKWDSGARFLYIYATLAIGCMSYSFTWGE